MRLHLIAAAVLTAVPAIAQVNPSIHKLCLEAKDYAGCVKLQAGSKSEPQTVINNLGAAMATGNRCPSGYAYSGAGYCRAVYCNYKHGGFGIPTGHDPLVAGKDKWACKHSFWVGAGVLTLGEAIRIGTDPNCPDGEPTLGWNSTCGATGIVIGGKND